MKKFEKAIIYMLVALFVAVSTVLVDFNTSYALSSYNDVPDADWKYFIAGNTANTALNKGERDTPSLPLPDGRPTDFVSVTNCQYVENLAYYNVKSNYCTGENVTISSDAEIVLVLDYVHAIPGHQAGNKEHHEYRVFGHERYNPRYNILDSTKCRCNCFTSHTCSFLDSFRSSLHHHRHHIYVTS